MALDGPKGPYHKAKEGSLWLSKKANLPIVTFSIKKQSRPKYWRLKTWDKMILPFPFSKVEFVMSTPFYPSSTQEISKNLNELEQ